MNYLAKCPVCYHTTIHAYPGIIGTNEEISCTAGESGEDCVNLILYKKVFGELGSTDSVSAKNHS